MAVKRISGLFLMLFFALFSVWGLSACGKTGKLYLPDDAPPAIGKTSNKNSSE